MIDVTCADVAAAVGGTVHGLAESADQIAIRSVVADSRAVVPGAMFVAITGAQVDGHDYAVAAIQAGAVLVLAARQLPVPCIVVDDPVQALGRLAHWYRQERLAATVVAITGSSGKTSTKDLVAAVLSTAGSTVAAPGSFNTEVGVPLTVLSAEPSTQYLVLEMGMRGPGHIDYLCRITEPDIAVIVNVGSAHVGMLGSVEAIADAKGEIIAGLAGHGIAVLNGDDPRVMSQSERTSARVVTFGAGSACQVRATDVRIDSQARASFTLHATDPVGAVPVTLRYQGEHFVSNALAAAAVGLCCGLPLDVVGAALRATESTSPMRMQIQEERHGITVINDAYNANPESMAAALRTLAVMAAGRRSWAVLGQMRELGDSTNSAHEEIGRLAAELGISRLLCIGTPAEAVASGAASVAGWTGQAQALPDIAAAAALLRESLLADDIVLVKASRGIALDEVLVQVFSERLHLDSEAVVDARAEDTA